MDFKINSVNEIICVMSVCLIKQNKWQLYMHISIYYFFTHFNDNKKYNILENEAHKQWKWQLMTRTHPQSFVVNFYVRNSIGFFKILLYIWETFNILSAPCNFMTIAVIIIKTLHVQDCFLYFPLVSDYFLLVIILVIRIQIFSIFFVFRKYYYFIKYRVLVI